VGARMNGPMGYKKSPFLVGYSELQRFSVGSLGMFSI
jgi:hypothetical protein